MKKAGQVVLFLFPQTNMEKGKPRPALLIAKVPGKYDDWLISMFSTKIHQHIPGIDEIIQPISDDYNQSGLKTKSIIRVTRLAVVSGNIFLGPMGNISNERLKRIKNTLSSWIQNS